MRESAEFLPDPSLDLVLERTAPVSIEKVWDAWTNPEKLVKWFCPLPWRTTECEIDLRPGGIFRTQMEGPNGESGGGAGCYLEVIDKRKLVWTSALGPGFRPQGAEEEGGFHFTAVLTFESVEGGTKYRAHVIHATESGKQQHEAMGFSDGWGAAWDQLVAMIKSED